jgi:hypothetical protein
MKGTEEQIQETCNGSEKFRVYFRVVDICGYVVNVLLAMLLMFCCTESYGGKHSYIALDLPARRRAAKNNITSSSPDKPRLPLLSLNTEAIKPLYHVVESSCMLILSG